MAKNLNHKVNCFLVGTAKAGTTSIFHYLDQHEDVFTPLIKEPNYFSKDVDQNKFSNIFKQNLPKEKPAELINLKKSVQQAFVSQEVDYINLYSNSSQKKILIDASTGYLYSEKAAAEIKSYNENAKIIIVLRNPISRTFSHYKMALKYGFESKSLIEAVKSDQNKKEKGIGQSELYIEMSLYYNSLKRYLDVFNESQIKFMFFENLITNEENFMSEICEFLDISTLDSFDKTAQNQGTLPKFARLNKIATQIGVKKLAKSILSNKAQKSIQSNFFSNNKNTTLTSDEISFLMPFFKTDVEKTKALLPHLNFPW